MLYMVFEKKSQISRRRNPLYVSVPSPRLAPSTAHADIPTSAKSTGTTAGKTNISTYSDKHLLYPSLFLRAHFRQKQSQKSHRHVFGSIAGWARIIDFLIKTVSYQLSEPRLTPLAFKFFQNYRRQ